jgi:hypothetical protein
LSTERLLGHAVNDKALGRGLLPQAANLWTPNGAEITLSQSNILQCTCTNGAIVHPLLVRKECDMNTSMLSGVRRRLAVGAATLPLVIGGLAIATAGPADALTCTHPAWSDSDKSGSGRVTANSTPMRTGPEASCGVVAWVNTSATLWYHCYVFNSAGNTWTNVRIDGTNLIGWIYDGNLNDGGSTQHC